MKIIPNAFGEKPILKLMFGAMIRAAAAQNIKKITLAITPKQNPSPA